jgi:hypothetical protein
VGHHQRGHAVQHPAQRRLDLGLSVDVQRGQRIVEHEHRRMADHRAGERQPLPLTAGQRQALLADPGVQAPGQRIDERLGMGDPQRAAHVVVAGLRCA